jgi:hypothetical protein
MVWGARGGPAAPAARAGRRGWVGWAAAGGAMPIRDACQCEQRDARTRPWPLAHCSHWSGLERGGLRHARRPAGRVPCPGRLPRPAAARFGACSDCRAGRRACRAWAAGGCAIHLGPRAVAGRPPRLARRRGLGRPRGPPCAASTASSFEIGVGLRMARGAAGLTGSNSPDGYMAGTRRAPSPGAAHHTRRVSRPAPLPLQRPPNLHPNRLDPRGAAPAPLPGARPPISPPPARAAF